MTSSDPSNLLEYVQGETLEQTLTRGVLSLEEFVDIARQCLEGMVAAHHAGLIHRDIKPSNLILTRLATGSFQVKILDFWIAKYLQAPAAQTMNIDGTIMGSICWISPEQLNGDHVDERSDIYSLGCVFYFALAGKPPFDCEKMTDTITAHLMHQLEPLAVFRPDLPEPLCEWVTSLMRREPVERPATVMQALSSF